MGKALIVTIINEDDIGHFFIYLQLTFPRLSPLQSTSIMPLKFNLIKVVDEVIVQRI